MNIASFIQRKFISRLLMRSTLMLFGQVNFLRRLQWPELSRLLSVEDGQTIVDLGAGPMHYSIELAQLARLRVIAVDVEVQNERAIDAREHGVLPVCASGYALPFTENSVDRILMSSLLHMVPDPQQLLRECRRVLRPEGFLVLSVPNDYQFIPCLIEGRGANVVQRLFGFPKTHADLVSELNGKFSVNGPLGYYSLDKVGQLLREGGFKLDRHVYSPRKTGSLLWEMGVLGFLKIGNASFFILFFTLPIARLFDNFSSKPFVGSEHVLRAVVDFPEQQSSCCEVVRVS